MKLTKTIFEKLFKKKLKDIWLFLKKFFVFKKYLVVKQFLNLKIRLVLQKIFIIKIIFQKILNSITFIIV